MKKIIAIALLAALALPVMAKEKTIDSGKVTYEIVKREKQGAGRFDLVCRVRITEPTKPSEKQVRAVASDVFKTVPASSYWKGMMTVFIYIDDMPLDNAAYGVADGHDKKLESFKLNHPAYELWVFVRSQKGEA